MKPPLRTRSARGLRELKPYLDDICRQVETTTFISSDPVLFMHAFEEKKDREIAGFMAALFAWGRRSVVLDKTEELLRRIEYRPYRFVAAYRASEADRFRGFRHRTFKQSDLHGLFSALSCIYSRWPDFEAFWQTCMQEATAGNVHPITRFRYRFANLAPDLLPRTLRHLPDPSRQSTCKRLCMFLRWCNRHGSPVDPGIWSLLSNRELSVPMDVHVARESRRFGLLSRRSDDWQSVVELTERFRELDPEDPSRYDFALFGVGSLGHRIPSRFILNRQR